VEWRRASSAAREDADNVPRFPPQAGTPLTSSQAGLLVGRAVRDRYRQLSVALTGRLRCAMFLAPSTIGFKSFQA